MFTLFLPSGTQHTSHRTAEKARFYADSTGLRVRITASKRDIARGLASGDLCVHCVHCGKVKITGSAWTVEERESC